MQPAYPVVRDVGCYKASHALPDPWFLAPRSPLPKAAGNEAVTAKPGAECGAVVCSCQRVPPSGKPMASFLQLGVAK